ncbi:MAG TPA: outer membrane beta-barrel protein [Xanthobacteraceae bacterium]
MRRILGLVLATTLAGPAMAADMGYPPMKAPPSYAPAFSWTGTYVGANLGGAWGTFDFNPFTTNNLTGAVGAPGVVSLSDTSVIGGFQAGYNWQIGQWVLGLEQDYQFTGLKQTLAFAAPAGLFRAGDSIAAKTDYLAATRVRAGWAWDRVLVYAAGGVETGAFDVTSAYVARGAGGSPALGFTDANKLHFGFNVGAGVDYAITNNVFLGVEYRYVDLGKETYNLGAFTPAGAAAQTVTNTLSLTASQVTARLNFKLEGLGLFGM